MPNQSPNYRSQLTKLLFLFCICVSISGCQIMGIPSHRIQESDNVLCGDGLQGTAECPPGILPPLPGWLSKWCHKEEPLPEPGPYPRFHPLPTRPMFSPAPPQQTQLGGFPGLGVPQVQLPVTN